MRLLRSLLWCVTLGGLGIIGLLFLVQNLHAERLVFFGVAATINFTWVVAGAAAVGFLLALLLIVPGRIATALYARALDRELGRLEEQVALLREQRERLLDGREQLLLRYERLFAHHDKAIAERERMRAQLTAAVATTAAATTTATARQPLELRARESGTEREVRAAPVRIGAVAADEAQPASVPAGADANARTSAGATANATTHASSARILPPVPVAPDPPPARLLPITPDPPHPLGPPKPPAMPLIAPDPPIALAPPAAAGTRDDLDTPPIEAGQSQLRERVAAYTAAARERMEQWRAQAGRVRRSAGARYNDMRTTLMARAHAAAGHMRQLSAPSGPPRRDAAPADTRAPSTSAASARDGNGHGHGISTLKGEQPLWRPPE